MNITDYILEYLRNHNEVVVPQFGIFRLENSKAVINSNGTILPPSQKINFIKNYDIIDDKLYQFISTKKRGNTENIYHELNVQTHFWKNKLILKKDFEIEKIGKFIFSDEDFIFEGEKISQENSNFYGLEEINLNELKSQNEKNNAVEEDENNVENYKFNNSILWIFLLLIPILGILYLGITQSERLFGKKSFEDISVKTRRIEKDSTKKDSSQINKIDSLKQDSLQKISAAPKQNFINKSGFKKYSNKKWKAKKHQNH